VWIKRWSWLKWLWVLVIPVSLVLPTGAIADTSAGVVVTATGYICEAPGGFTITYVNDYELRLDWTVGTDAVNTMVRAAYGRFPEDITDGYQVYYGTGTTTTDDATSLAAPDIVYYRAWSQNVAGLWNEVSYGEDDSGDIMSVSFLFIAWVSLAIFLTWFSSRRPELLIKLVAGLTWMALGFWVLLGGITNLDMINSWNQILVWVFFIMAVVPFLAQMNTEIRKEKKGLSYTVWGTPPDESETEYQRYSKELRYRMHRHKKKKRLL